MPPAAGRENASGGRGFAALLSLSVRLEDSPTAKGLDPTRTAVLDLHEWTLGKRFAFPVPFASPKLTY